MRGRSYPLSIAAAGVFPALLFFSLAAGSWPVGAKVLFLVSLLFALGVCLWRPIHPMVFGGLLGPAAALWWCVIAGASRSGNLFGLTLIAVFVVALGIGATAGSIGLIAISRGFPSWIPLASVGAGAALLVFAWMSGALRAIDEDRAIDGYLRKIATAESVWAAGTPDRTYTCDGPNLKGVPGIAWRTDYNLGGPLRNQGEHGHYWITLTCEPAGHVTWFMARAAALFPGGPRLSFDSRSGEISDENRASRR